MTADTKKTHDAQYATSPRKAALKRVAPRRKAPVTPTRTLEPFDALRAKVLDRMRQVGLTMIDLSRAAGKNDSYAHQWIYYGVPAQRLREEVREVWGQMLGMHPDDLADRATDRKGAPHPLVEGQARAVALYLETDPLDPDSPREMVTGIRAGDALTHVAVQITRHYGHYLAAGDIIYLSKDEPTHVGDLVAAQRGDKIVAIGALESLTETRCRIRAGENDTPATIMLGSTVKIRKITIIIKG
jgi:hypothetical protein